MVEPHVVTPPPRRVQPGAAPGPAGRRTGPGPGGGSRGATLADMRALDAARRHARPGLLLLALALAAAAAIYAPTLGRGLVSYDDPWLVGDNFIVGQPSLHALHQICCDLDPRVRYALGAEYLPVRDASMMLDVALWGD